MAGALLRLRLLATGLLLALAVPALAVPPGWPGALPSAPSERLEAWFLGNTTLLFRAGDQAILIDGFLSRPTLDEFVFRRLATDEGLVERCLAAAGVRVGARPDGATLQGVLVAHGHYDHALDAVHVARLTGARVGAAPSTLAVLPRADGVRFHEFTNPAPEAFGRFTVRAFRFPHSLPNLFWGGVRRPVEQPAHVLAFRDRGSSAFHITIDGFRILIHPSAGYIAGGYGEVRADVVFLSVGGLGTRGPRFARRYWQEVVEGRGARLVIPVHWDRINRPLRRGFAFQATSDRPFPVMPALLAMARAEPTRRPGRTVAGVDQAPELRLMPFFAPVDLRGASAALPEGEPLSLAAPDCALS